MKLFKKSGFTLIELLVVVAVIGVLAAVLVQVINPQRARGSARDGVRTANVEKLAQAIEAYGAAEGKYPVTADVVPIMSETVKQYIKNWPQADPSTEYSYEFLSDGDKFSLYVKTERSSVNSCLKYSSTLGELRHCSECGSTVSDKFGESVCTPYAKPN